MYIVSNDIAGSVGPIPVLTGDQSKGRPYVKNTYQHKKTISVCIAMNRVVKRSTTEYLRERFLAMDGM